MPRINPARDEEAMAKKDSRTKEKPPRADSGGPVDEPLDISTLLWAFGILAVLVVLQRLIWGE